MRSRSASPPNSGRPPRHHAQAVVQVAPTDKLTTPTESAASDGAEASSLARHLHVAVFGLLLVAGLAYWILQPSSINPMADSRAAEAMALVQTHRARHAPTLRQAITDRVQVLAKRGQGVRLGEWRVEREGDRYLVKIFVREREARSWFEREYLWRVDLDMRSVVAFTQPASELMPADLEGPSPTDHKTPSP